MSDESIELNDELINGLVNVIVQHDADAASDMILGLQYLAAVSGYIAAGYPGSAEERDRLLQHLADFTRHVCNDRAAQQRQAQAQQPVAEAPKGRSSQTDDPAIGIWKPE